MSILKNKSGFIITTLVTISYTILMYVLFYRQSIAYGGAYLSDMEAYILEARGLDSGYDFPYPLMFAVSRFFDLFMNPHIAMALTVTLLNTLSLVFLRHYMAIYVKRIVSDANRQWNLRLDIAVTLLTLSLLFVSMVYAPKGHGFFGFDYIYRCSGVYTPNPYWNATYLATRPFSIICFFSGITMMEKYEEGAAFKEYAVFAVSLFLTTITKPSYTFVAVITFAVILGYRFLRSRGKNFKMSFWFGLTFIPSGLALLYQYASVFTGTNSHGEETGIGFAIGKAWSIYSGNIPLSMVMALAFPAGVLLINLTKLKGCSWFRHGWQIITVGWLMLLCLYEKGFRMEHTNFSWGYMHGLFFVFTVSVLMLLQNTIAPKGKIRTAIVAAGWLGYLWHLGCGIVYFLYIYAGNNSGLF